MSGEYPDFEKERYVHSLLTAPNYAAGGSYLFSPLAYTGAAESAGSRGSAIDGFLSAKTSRSEDRIEAIIEAIEKRRLIKEENFYGIERDLCACQNLLFEMGYKVYRRDRDWLALETRKIDLERDRRMELAAYFRDVLLLGKELRDTLEYRQSVLDKAKMLGGNTTQDEIQL